MPEDLDDDDCTYCAKDGKLEEGLVRRPGVVHMTCPRCGRGRTFNFRAQQAGEGQPMFGAGEARGPVMGIFAAMGEAG